METARHLTEQEADRRTAPPIAAPTIAPLCHRVADPSTARIIDLTVRVYRPDSVPVHEGTRTDIRFRMWGLPVRAVSVVEHWEPGVRMAMESERPACP